MNGPSIFRIGAWIFTGAGDAAACEADPGAFKLCPSLRRLCSIPAHNMACPAYRQTVIIDDEIVFVNRRPSAFAVEINKRCDAMFPAVFIIRHGVMGGVQNELLHISFGEKPFHRIPGIQETV